MEKPFKRSKRCPFTSNGSTQIDYKNLKMLEKYISETGKIIPSRISGVKPYFQRQLTIAIKHARFLALLPYCDQH